VGRMAQIHNRQKTRRIIILLQIRPAPVNQKHTISQWVGFATLRRARASQQLNFAISREDWQKAMY
jgi:hypothetical protein